MTNVKADREKAAAAIDRFALVATKLRIPPARRHLVSRPPLTEALNRTASAALTLVSAPAGFGKTALLAEWCHTRPGGAAWISLDVDDNAPVRFWTYLLTALETHAPGVAAASLSMLHTPQHPPIQAVLTPFVNAMVACEREITLILDDYHVIRNASIHEALGWLLEQLPPNLRFVIASRSDPPLPLARLRARGQLFELRASSLRFSRSETGAFLNETMALGLDKASVTLLHDRTEGWIAGLQLIALTLQGTADAEARIRKLSGSQRHIFDYLVAEIIDDQPDDVKRFLLDSCILPRLCGPLCDAVAERQDSQSMLERLETANLFLFPLDTDREWYRYHQLFAEALMRYLQQRESEQVTALHHRASDWFETHGFTSEALAHALAANDTARAARLIETEALTLVRRGDLVTLHAWLTALPEEVVAAHPRFCALLAWIHYLQGQVEGASRWLEHAEATSPQDEIVLGEVMAVQSAVAGLRANIGMSLDLARRAHDLLPEDHPLRGLEAMTLAARHIFSGHPAAATAAFQEAARLNRRQGNTLLATYALYQAGEGALLQGKLHEAELICRDIERLATLPNGHKLSLVGLAYVGMGELARERNALEEAESLLTRGLALCRQVGDKAALASLLPLARLRQAKGEYDAALDTVEMAARLVEQLGAPGVDQLIAVHKARLWLLQGHRDVVGRWAREAARTVKALPTPIAEQVHLNLARVELTLGKASQASKRLENLRPPALEANRMASVLQILVLQALAHAAQGRAQQALMFLSSALARAESEGFVRTFVDEGAPLARLLIELRAARAHEAGALQGWTNEYLERLLDACGHVEPTTPAQLPAYLESLSSRELDILRHVASGASNKQVAKALAIAPGTVKWHLNTIYGKLQVNSRTQAVARARELGLL